MKSKFNVGLLASLLCAVVCLFACTKKQKGTFIVKGRLTDSCGGKPLAFSRVRVNFARRVGFKPLIKHNVGIDTTDANGNFEMVCQNWDKGEIDIIGPSPHINDFTVSGEEGRVYDFGELPHYSSVKATLKIIPLVAFSATDTLYIGDKWIHPIPSSIFTDYLTGAGNATENINPNSSAFRVRTRTVY